MDTCRCEAFDLDQIIDPDGFLYRWARDITWDDDTSEHNITYSHCKGILATGIEAESFRENLQEK